MRTFLKKTDYNKPYTERTINVRKSHSDGILSVEFLQTEKISNMGI